MAKRTFATRNVNARMFKAATLNGDGPSVIVTAPNDGWIAQSRSRGFIATSRDRVWIATSRDRVWIAKDKTS